MSRAANRRWDGWPHLGAPALLIGVLVACGAQPEATPPRNVLVVVVDTLRRDHLGIYGAQRPTSPAIDQLASEATTFDRAYSTAPWTQPAVGSMLTGLYPTSHGVERIRQRLADEHTTLAEILRQQGFATRAAVTHTLIGRQYGYAQGFDEFLQWHARGHAYVSTPGVTQQALDALDGLAQDGRRFFLFLHYFDPHYEYLRHPEIGWAPESVGRLVAGKAEQTLRGLEAPTALEQRYVTDLYDEEIRFTDSGIGRVLAKLDALELADETLVVFSADHGEEFYERGCLGHAHSLHDELIRVPLLIRAPGRPAARVDAPVSLASLTPTVLELLGVEADAARFQAPSIAWRVGRDGDPNEEAPILFSEVDFQVGLGRKVGGCPPKTTRASAVVAGRYKLIHDEIRDSYQLYDLASDPGERTDIFEQEPEVAARLAAEIAERERTIPRFDAEEISVTHEQMEGLKALGYVESDR